MGQLWGIIDYIDDFHINGWIRSKKGIFGELLVSSATPKKVNYAVKLIDRKDLHHDNTLIGFIITAQDKVDIDSINNHTFIVNYAIDGLNFNLEIWDHFLAQKPLYHDKISKGTNYFEQEHYQKENNLKQPQGEKQDLAFIYGLDSPDKQYSLLSTDTNFKITGHNTGNVAFNYAISCHVQGLKFGGMWGKPVPKNFIDSKCIGIIPCANQLGSHTGRITKMEIHAKIIREQECSFVAIGLGIQSELNKFFPEISAGVIEWIKAIGEKKALERPNIGIRGKFTLALLEHYGIADKATIIGCPSLFINPNPNLGKQIFNNFKKPTRIAVAAGHQDWSSLVRIETSLARLVTETSGSYIGQSGIEMVHFTRGEAELLDEKALKDCRDYIAPEMSYNDLILWSKKYGNVFFSATAWMEHYRHFDFVIGARIHGIMLALQVGVPALCIVHDLRTLELCQTMMVPYVLASDISDGITIDDIERLFKFDPDEFDNNRKILCKNYIDFLRGNNLIPSRSLYKITHPD